MQIVTLDNGREVLTGCYVDGHEGVYGIISVIQISIDLGMILKSEDVDILATYEQTDEFLEEIHDIEFECVQWMNSITPERFVWEWIDGEFYLTDLNDLDD